MSPLWITTLTVVAISLAAFGVCVVTFKFGREHSIQGNHHNHSPASNTTVTDSHGGNGSTENSRQLDHYSHYSPAFSTTATDNHYSNVSSRPTVESKPTTTEITLQNTSHSDVFTTSKELSIPSRILKKKKKRRRQSCSNLLRPRRRKRIKNGNDITRRRRRQKRIKSRNDVIDNRKRPKRIKNKRVFTSSRRRKERIKNRSDVTRRRRRRKQIKNGNVITGKRKRRKQRKKGSDVTPKLRRRKLRKKGSRVTRKRRRKKRIKKGSDATRILSRQKRIVQGDEVRRGQFPWMVMVVVKGDFVCGGTIIGSRHVLTAAHCLRSSYRPLSRKDGFSSFYNASDVEIIAGKHSYVINSSLHDVTSEQRVSVRRVIPHDKYDDTKKVAKHYDLAILELNHTLRWTKWVSPICLPGPAPISKSCVPKKATVIGWGSIKPRYRLNWIPQPPDALQQLKVKLGARKKCVKRLQASFQYVDYMTSRQICAVSVKTGISSTCNGDSGGPLFIKVRGGQHVQLGVLSWGYCLGMPGVPSFFTYLPHFVPWIRKEIGRNGRCSQ